MIDYISGLPMVGKVALAYMLFLVILLLWMVWESERGPLYDEDGTLIDAGPAYREQKAREERTRAKAKARRSRPTI